MKLAKLIRGVAEVHRLLDEYGCHYLFVGQAALAAYLAQLVTKLATEGLAPPPAVKACLYGDRPGPLVRSLLFLDLCLSAEDYSLTRKYIVELVPDDILDNRTSRAYVAVALPKSDEIIEVPTSLVVDRVMHLVRSWLASLAPGHHTVMRAEDFEELRLLAGTQSYVETSLGRPQLFDLNLAEWTRHLAYIIPEHPYKATAKLLFNLASLHGAPRLAWDNTTAEHFVSTSPDFHLIQSQWAAALGLLMARFQIPYQPRRAGTATW
ncbi:hypothetical protein JCM9279_000120 [Rhodotorula babjevae]